MSVDHPARAFSFDPVSVHENGDLVDEWVWKRVSVHKNGDLVDECGNVSITVTQNEWFYVTEVPVLGILTLFY